MHRTRRVLLIAEPRNQRLSDQPSRVLTSRNMHARTRVLPEDPRLLRGLRSTRAVQSFGPIRRQQHKLDARVRGLHQRRKQIRNSGTGRRDHSNRRIGRHGQPQGQEPGLTLIEPRMNRQHAVTLSLGERIRQRRRTRTGRNHHMLHPSGDTPLNNQTRGLNSRQRRHGTSL